MNVRGVIAVTPARGRDESQLGQPSWSPASAAAPGYIQAALEEPRNFSPLQFSRTIWEPDWAGCAGTCLGSPESTTVNECRTPGLVVLDASADSPPVPRVARHLLRAHGR